MHDQKEAADRQEDLVRATHGFLSDADCLIDCYRSCQAKAQMYAAAAASAANNGVREFFLAFHGETTWMAEVYYHFLHARGLFPTDEASQDQMDRVWERHHAKHDAMGITDAPYPRQYETTHPDLPPAETVTDDDRYHYKSN